MGACCSSGKRLAFCPFLWGFWSDLTKNFIGSLFPHSHSSTKFCPSPYSLRGDIYENVFQTRYNIGVKHIGFSPTKIKYKKKTICIPTICCTHPSKTCTIGENTHHTCTKPFWYQMAFHVQKIRQAASLICSAAK